MLANSDDVESSDENVQDESDEKNLIEERIGEDDNEIYEEPGAIKSAPVTLVQVAVDDWVWVKFTDRKYYAGQVQVVCGNYEFGIKFLRHMSLDMSGHISGQTSMILISDIKFPQIVKKLKKLKIGRRGEIIFEAADLL